LLLYAVFPSCCFFFSMLTLKIQTYDVKLVSFESDTYVAILKVPKSNPDKLTHTFRYGGAKLLSETLGSHFCIDVRKYVRVNFSLSEKLVDEVGGVDVALTKTEAETISYNTASKVKEGKKHLNGEAALCYPRFRN